MLQAVYSDNPALEVALVDHDDLASLEQEPNEPEIPAGLAQVF